MHDDDRYAAVRAIYGMLESRLTKLAGQFVDDPEAVTAEAAERFEAGLPELAYADDPAHPMALSMFFCAANLAMYLGLRTRGVDVHEYGRAMLDDLRNDPVPEPDFAGMLDVFAAAGEASQTEAAPGDFVFEVFTEGADFDWGINVTSCAICAHFSKHDAMELVPYMCASDDVMSDQAGDGLRRTGTIALGATHCDFRYQAGGDPLRVADQFPERIKIRPSSPSN